VGFHVSRLALSGFRNYANADFKLSEKLTVLVGPNAAGKTNVIEAIQLLTAAESFRNPLWDDLVMWGRDVAQVSLEASDERRKLTVELDVRRGKGREFRVNGSVKRRLMDVRGIIPSVVFTPDDLGIVKGSAERRRTMVDAIGQQISPAYGALRREYERIVRQRNAGLKERAEPGVMDALTLRLAETGGKLAAHRIRLLSRVGDEARGIHEVMSGGEELGLEYVASWTTERDLTEIPMDAEDIEQAILDTLRRLTEEEKVRGITLAGPHRDDVAFSVGGHGARAFSSQGQQRSVALSVKMAEVHVVRDLASSPPILLLDDVMSELDEQRRHELTGFVGGLVQTVVTTTNLHYFEPSLLSSATVLEVAA